MKLAIIPARGGSKRIPRKNIKTFCGKPMIAWSIEAARSSGCFDRIIISTDDDEIATVARAYGAEVPFARPPDLSDDYIPTRPVVNHAIQEARALWGNIDLVCCIYATAPFLNAEDLRRGLMQLRASTAQFAFAVTTFPYPIQRALRVTPEGRVGMLFPDNRESRSQDLEVAYHDAGQFYWGRTEAFLANLDMFSADTVPVLMPRTRVQDIDTEEDWLRAELMLRALQDSGEMGR